MAGKRMIITLSEEEKDWLESYSEASGISMAEAVRQGVEKLRETNDWDTYRKVVEATRGLWKTGDGLKYQREIRSEWKARD